MIERIHLEFLRCRREANVTQSLLEVMCVKCGTDHIPIGRSIKTRKMGSSSSFVLLMSQEVLTYSSPCNLS
jgi:predicted RNA-binding Zn-ribbon protein involved in translation (DUF1610 family)